MKARDNFNEISSWSVIIDRVYGKTGTERHDNPESETVSFRIGLLLKKAHESGNMTQEELGRLIDIKRECISRVENNWCI
ncbi:MAG: helix-turn-helix transcriptional regulator [Bacteroidota bacterium]